MKTVWQWLILGSLLLGLAACSGKQSAPLTVTGQNNGQTVTLKPGQVLVVRLESNPTTGYAWQLLAADPAVIKQVGEAGFTPAPVATGVVGAGGTAEWRFAAAGEGTTTIILNYRRPWEKDTRPAQTFTLTVTVKR